MLKFFQIQIVLFTTGIIKTLLYYSGHVYCSRHICENVQRHLTDKGVDVNTRKAVVTLVEQCRKVGANTSMVGDTAVRNLMDHVRANLPHHVDYFTNHALVSWRRTRICCGNTKGKYVDGPTTTPSFTTTCSRIRPNGSR